MHTAGYPDANLRRVSDDHSFSILPCPSLDSAVGVVRATTVKQYCCLALLVDINGAVIASVGNRREVNRAG